MSEKNLSDHDRAILEESLRTSLYPVAPDRVFVKRLWGQLENSTSSSQQIRFAKQLLTIAVGLLVGFAIFILGRDLIKENH